MKITTRFANPYMDNGKYILDVQFKADTPDYYLSGMNLRFLYDSSQFTKSTLVKNLHEGYAPLLPTYPNGVSSVNTGSAASGGMFGFSGPATYLNGAVTLTDQAKAPVLTSDWVTLFQVHFTPQVGVRITCPVVVWDLEQNPANGGYFPGSDGVVMNAVKKGANVSIHVSEAVENHNWKYEGTGATLPFGRPSC